MAYVRSVILLNFFVDMALLLAAGRLSGYPPDIKRTVLGALAGAGYAGACMLPQLYFLGNMLWRMVFLGLVAMTAYGLSQSTLRRGAVYIFLNLALGGAAMGFKGAGIYSVLGGAGILLILCATGFHGSLGGRRFVPVELSYGGKHIRLTALCDTGNMLTDPLTGQPVLVVGPDEAGALTGLTRRQLQEPAESMGLIPGLRLIPYSTIGQAGGLLLALRVQDVRIGTWKGSSLVAFAPERLGGEGNYQALTGGIAC